MAFDVLTQHGTAATPQAAKQILPAATLPLVTTVAKPMFSVAIAALENFCCFIRARIYVTDGTDVQAFTEVIAIAMVNKAGTITKTITDLAGAGAKAVSAGTLTTSWTSTDTATGTTINVTATTSLTPTTFTVSYEVMQLSERVVTLL